MKNDLKNNAIKLRIEDNLSYNEILKILPVSKSTLSLWLRDYPLSKDILRKKALDGVTKSKCSIEIKKESKYLSNINFFDHYNKINYSNYSTDQKGAISEAAVIFRLKIYGFWVFSSIFDGAKSDLIVQSEKGKLLKIQVKSVETNKHKNPYISLLCNNGRNKKRKYDNSEFDYLIGYYLMYDKAYIFSNKDLEKYKCSITISQESEENWEKIIWGS